MWVLFLLKIVFVTGIPALIIWLWRGQFLGKNLVGTRRERHRQQLGRSSKQLFTIWGIMVLSTADQIISWNPISRDFHQFWRGFFVASDLFLSGFLIANTLPFVQEMREKRQSQPPKSARANLS